MEGTYVWLYLSSLPVHSLIICISEVIFATEILAPSVRVVSNFYVYFNKVALRQGADSQIKIDFLVTQWKMMPKKLVLMA